MAESPPGSATISDPAKWYWVVAGDTARVYSSADAGYVGLRDPKYMDWLAAGYQPTQIASEQELWDYLIGRVVNSTPANATSTDAAKDARIKNQLQDVIYQIAYSHESRLRTLEGLPAITQEQFLDRVKGIMK